MDYENQRVSGIIGAAIDVHVALGPGLLENVYKECLFYKLKKCGYAVEKEHALPVVFEGTTIECGYRLGLLINFNTAVLKNGIKRVINGY